METATSVFARAHELFGGSSALRGRIRFDVEGIGSWVLEIDDRGVRTTRGPGAADLIIGCTESDLLQILRGERNLLTAMMQGRVFVDGDIALAQRLESHLPGPR